MVQLQIISGKQAGVLWDARRFPVRIGRAADSDLRLDDDGVWDTHLTIQLRDGEGFTFAAQPGALVSVNQNTPENARLRNGDVLTLGSVKLAFRLSPTRQSSLVWRESLVWLAITGVTIGQCALLAWLLK